MATKVGMMSIPACRAVRPWTIWKNWVKKKNVTSMPNKISPMMRTAPVKSFWRKNFNGSMGWSVRISTRAKAMSRAAAALNDATISGDDHPASGP